MFLPIAVGAAAVGLMLRSPRQEANMRGTPVTIYLPTDEDAMYHRQWWFQRGYHVGILYIDRQPNTVLIPRNH